MPGPPPLQLAWQLFRGNQVAQAESLCRELLQTNAHDPGTLHLLGTIANQKGQWQTAIDLLQQSLRNRPDVPEAFVALGIAFFNLDRLDDSHRALSHALALNTNDPDAHQNMAILQRRLENLPLSAEHFERALSLDPNRPLLRVYYAMVLRELGRFDQSDEQLHLALQSHPSLPDAHMQIAWNHLLQGRFTEGFAAYEWRWRCAGAKFPVYAKPLWTGSDPAGRTLLLHAEQGFGDTLQFIRYARLLADRGVTVILHCPEPLRELLSTVSGVSQAVSDARKLPPFDFWLPLLSLPHRFGTTLNKIPATVPYIAASPQRLSKWSEIVRNDPPGIKVGLAWTGSRSNPTHAHRSIPTHLLTPLSQVPGVVLYSLQIERSDPAPFPLIDHTAAISDFADSAALVAHLDLVISIDTAAAHLAGAMGKKIWTLLRPVPEWRWLLNRPDSPWYPTMRLFRAKSLAWEPLIDEVAASLRAYIEDNARPMASGS